MYAKSTSELPVCVSRLSSKQTRGVSVSGYVVKVKLEMKVSYQYNVLIPFSTNATTGRIFWSKAKDTSVSIPALLNNISGSRSSAEIHTSLPSIYTAHDFTRKP